jgi:hypothetical protein
VARIVSILNLVLLKVCILVGSYIHVHGATCTTGGYLSTFLFCFTKMFFYEGRVCKPKVLLP